MEKNRHCRSNACPIKSSGSECGAGLLAHEPTTSRKTPKCNPSFMSMLQALLPINCFSHATKFASSPSRVKWIQQVHVRRPPHERLVPEAAGRLDGAPKLIGRCNDDCRSVGLGRHSQGGRVCGRGRGHRSGPAAARAGGKAASRLPKQEHSDVFASPAYGNGVRKQRDAAVAARRAPPRDRTALMAHCSQAPSLQI